MPKDLNLTSLHQLHRTGQLDEAKKSYLALLKKNPTHPDILHALGIIETQKENYPDAIHYLERALKLNQKDPSIGLHLANVLKLQGLFTKAVDILNQLIKLHPTYYPALNNLGTVYYALGKFEKAIQCYQTVVKAQPRYIDAYYNLGLSYSKNRDMKEAENTYKTILELEPDHFAARFQLATLLMQNEQYEQAIQEFKKITENYSHHFETQMNLASCFLKQGNVDEAKNYYLNALDLSPEDTQLLFNLGVISMQQGYIDSAIQYYQRIVLKNPDHYPAHNNLGVAFIAKQHVGFAIKHFTEALRLQPANKAIQHTLKILSNNQGLLAAPSDYITSLFDSYADHYEPHLLQILGYQLPQLFSELFKKYLQRESSILDLGCGTGLCGEFLKPYSSKLVGVDLSHKMLEIAKSKHIYDELVQEDFFDYLKLCINTFDAIVAADVLVYSGPLEDIFEKIAFSLKEKGWFIFNAEMTEEKDFLMNQSGRFAHAKNYLETTCKKFGFIIIDYQKKVTRQQNNEPVYGHLFVLQKYANIEKMT